MITAELTIGALARRFTLRLPRANELPPLLIRHINLTCPARPAAAAAANHVDVTTTWF